MVPEILPDVNTQVRELAEPLPVRLRELESISEALSRVRRESNGERTVYFYVTDSSDQLVGVAPIRRLLLTEPSTLVGEIMMSPVFSVRQTDNLRSALALLTEQRLLALPVVDESGRLTGIFDVSGFTHRLVAWQRQEAAETVFQIFGVPARERSSGRDHFSSACLYGISFRIMIGIAGAVLMSLFGGVLRKSTELVYFIPCLLAVAETFAVQTLHWSLPRFPANPHGKQFSRMGPALALGLVWIVIVGAVNIIWLRNSNLWVALMCSLCVAITMAGMLGYWTPRFVRFCHLNSVLPAGPIVSAIAYLASLAVYFAVSSALT